MNLNILVLPGDGIGLEVTREAVRVLRVVAEKWKHQLTLREGRISWDLDDRAGKDYKTLGPSYGLRPGSDFLVVPPK